LRYPFRLWHLNEEEIEIVVKKKLKQAYDLTQNKKKPNSYARLSHTIKLF
jgi:hypothetical protein